MLIIFTLKAGLQQKLWPCVEGREIKERNHYGEQKKKKKSLPLNLYYISLKLSLSYQPLSSKY